MNLVEEYANQIKHVSVTIVGGSFYAYNRENLDLGEEIILRKEPTNRYDADAIVAYDSKMNKVGYVANRKETVRPSCIYATALGKLMGDEIIGKVSFDEYPPIVDVLCRGKL